MQERARYIVRAEEQCVHLVFLNTNGCTHRWRFSTFIKYNERLWYYANVSDVPRSLQSWVSTIQTVVLTADVFQLNFFFFTADVLQYFYELILYRSYSQLTFTIQTVVLTADVFQLEKYIFSEEVEKRQLWARPVWMVESQLCKLRGTSDTFV